MWEMVFNADKKQKEFGDMIARQVANTHLSLQRLLSGRRILHMPWFCSLEKAEVSSCRLPIIKRKVQFRQQNCRKTSIMGTCMTMEH